MFRVLRANISQTLSAIAADTGGVSAILAALALTAIAGFVGLGIDVSYWLTEQRNLQGVADQAAFSAAIAGSSDPATGETNARGIAAQFGYIDGQKSVRLAVNTPPAQGAYASASYSNIAWEVTISEVQPTFFTQIFMSAPNRDGTGGRCFRDFLCMCSRPRLQLERYGSGERECVGQLELCNRFKFHRKPGI